MPAGAEGLRRATLPKAARLRRRSEFLGVQRTGQQMHGTHFVVLLQRKPGPLARLGITVSKKVGCAVVRNRVKRQVRETFRQHRHLLPQGFDFLLIARDGAGSQEKRQLADETAGLLLRAAAKTQRPSGGAPLKERL